MGATAYRLPSILVGLGALALLAGPASGQTVGTTGAVNPSSTGTPPGGGERTLNIGANVVFKERIKTTAGGSLQVVFVDTTTLSVGPDSDLTIDEFVYNPKGGSGRFVASMTKGALRFVGGQISHRQGATINTPAATIGIRGGGAYIEVKRGKTVVVCTVGQCEVDTPDAPPVELDPGEGVSVGGGNSQQFAASPDALQQFQNTLSTGNPGQTGGDGLVLFEANQTGGNGMDLQGDPADNPNAGNSIEDDVIDDLDDQEIEQGPGDQDPEPPSPEMPDPPLPPDPPLD